MTYSGKHIGDPILKMIVEMRNEMDLIQKKNMEKYINDRTSGRVYLIQKPEEDVVTFNERKTGSFLNPLHIMAYFIFILNIKVKSEKYHLLDPYGNILVWESFTPLIPGFLYRVVKE